MSFFGEFQFCNRPQFGTSYLAINSPGGYIGGRIDWDCEMGLVEMLKGNFCRIHAGLLQFCKPMFEKSKKKEFDDGTDKAFEIVKLSGKICFIIRLASNDCGGLEIGIGGSGSIQLAIMETIGFGAVITGELTINLCPNENLPKFSGQIIFEGSINFLMAVFKVQMWISIQNNGEVSVNFYNPVKVKSRIGDRRGSSTQPLPRRRRRRRRARGRGDAVHAGSTACKVDHRRRWSRRRRGCST
jgi:hypothetical protein